LQWVFELTFVSVSILFSFFGSDADVYQRIDIGFFVFSKICLLQILGILVDNFFKLGLAVLQQADWIFFKFISVMPNITTDIGLFC
jgi:hypothetical protein